jgi:tRNA(Ile)-lysidine synthase
MKPTVLNTSVRRALDGLGVLRGGETIVAALSGGADSVALLDALAFLAPARRWHVVAAHLDHGLRGSSGVDAAFCAELCDSMSVPLVIERADVRGRAEREKGGLEAAARAERYAFLERVRRDRRAAVIGVAHTRDDQAETFLLQLLRGAGTTGLGAMRQRSGHVVRPLLDVSRADVLAHLYARVLPFREDPTNEDLGFRRNRVRHELIPYLERHFNPRVREALAGAARLCAAESDVLRAQAAVPTASFADEPGALSLEGLRRDPVALSRLRIRGALESAGGLKGVSRIHLDRILALLDHATPSGKRIALPGNREAEVSFGKLRLGTRRARRAPFAMPLEVPGRVTLPSGGAVVAEPAQPGSVSEQKGAVVAAPLGPLEVRTRRPGDRVRVRGRAVSLKRYLIAQRVPAPERASLPLVAAGREILWMPGCVSDGTGPRLLRLHLENA